MTVPKRPRDPNQLAKFIVDVATGNETEAQQLADGRDKDVSAVARGSKGGLIGGRARALALTPEERSEAGRLAAEARWRRRKD